MRASDDELRVWRNAAELEGYSSLSEWARRAMTQAAFSGGLRREVGAAIHELDRLESSLSEELEH